MSKKIQLNPTETIVPNNLIYEQDMINLAAEHNEQISEAISAELFQPLYEFAGTLTPDGTHHRYTRRINK